MNSLESSWRSHAERLSLREIYTETWRDFRSALVMRDDGDEESALAWTEEVEAQFLEQFGSFEDRGFLEESEGDNPAVSLAQQFLVEGVEAWLAALTGLREGADSEGIIHKARHGQQLLVTVQHMEKELEEALPQFEFLRG